MSPLHVIAHVLFFFVIAIEPILFIVAHRRLRKQLADQVTGARISFYNFVLVIEWFWTFAIAALVLLGYVSLERLGIREFDFTNAAPYTISFALLFALGPTVLFLYLPRMKNGPQLADKAIKAVGEIFPFEPNAKKLWFAVSVTAGICEEILYRGFIIDYLQTSMSLDLVWALLLGALIFGLGHIYQGLKGFVATTLYGFLFAGLYVSTGNLVLPIVIHVFIDLRVLLLDSRGPSVTDTQY